MNCGLAWLSTTATVIGLTRRRMRRRVAIRDRVIGASIAVAAVVAPQRAFAQTRVVELVFSSPPSPVGSGARAAGVGSAFIALADDATAASWNPGGLTQLERPELSVVGRLVHQVDEIGSGASTVVLNDVEQTFGANGERDEFTLGSLNYLSAAVPFTVLDRNVVVALNHQQMLSFERDLHFEVANQSPGIETHVRNRVLQTGGIDAATLAIALEPVPGLSIGAALNYWFDGLGHSYAWRETLFQGGELVFDDGTVIPLESIGQDTFRHFRGVNGAFGLLWRLADTIALGAVWKLPFTAHVDHTIRSTIDPNAPPDARQRHRLQFPASYGVGLSWRPVDRLTVSSDLTYVEWNRFRAVDSTGTEYLVTGDPASERAVDGIFTPRVGIEYLWRAAWGELSGRAGAFYDPEPARDSPKNYFGASLGGGATLEHFSVDFAYQVRFGLAVENTSTTIQLLDLPNVPADTIQHLVYTSLVFYL